MSAKSRNIGLSIAGAAICLALAALFHSTIFSAFAADSTAPTESSDASTSISFTAQGNAINVSDDAMAPSGIIVSKIEPKDVPETLTLTGKSALNMENATHVQPQFAGKIVSIGPKLGDVVKGPNEPGGPTVLCVIESNDLAQAKANWLQAKIQLKIDNDALARTRELYKANVLAEKSVIDAETAVIKDQATLEAAYQQLLIFGLKQKEIDDIEKQIGKQRMDYIITAPRSGVVTEKDVSEGEIASPGNNMFVIADTKTVWVNGNVYESDLPRIRLGEAMQVFFQSDPNRARDTKIQWISPVLDPNTHAVHIQAVLDNSDGEILSDMYCTIVVTISDGKDSLIVPADAVVRDGGDAYVFVQAQRTGASTRFELTKVHTDSIDVGFGASQTASSVMGSARTTGNSVQPTAMLRVVDGLKPGDMIITSGALGLYNEMQQQAGAM